jgi:hypothetical protein
MKEDGIGGACGMYGGSDMHTGRLWGSLKERNHWNNLGLYGRIILKWILKKLGKRAWT